MPAGSETHGANRCRVGSERCARERSRSARNQSGHNRMIGGHHKYALYCAKRTSTQHRRLSSTKCSAAASVACRRKSVLLSQAALAAADSRRQLEVPEVSSALSRRHFYRRGRGRRGNASRLSSSCAHALILPITQGGGTNLKTAEALWSGRRVVATPQAMREASEAFIDHAGCIRLRRRHCVSARCAGTNGRAAPSTSMPPTAIRDRSVLYASTLRPLVGKTGHTHQSPPMN